VEVDILKVLEVLLSVLDSGLLISFLGGHGSQVVDSVFLAMPQKWRKGAKVAPTRVDLRVYRAPRFRNPASYLLDPAQDLDRPANGRMMHRYLSISPRQSSRSVDIMRPQAVLERRAADSRVIHVRNQQ
jgi:hypothetical protein